MILLSLWSWFFDAFISISQTIYNAANYVLSKFFDLLLDFLFAIAKAFISLFPDAVPVVVNRSVQSAGGIPEWLLSIFSGINLFFDVNWYFATIGSIIVIELIMLIIHGIMWIKRFIPTMGY